MSSLQGLNLQNPGLAYVAPSTGFGLGDILCKVTKAEVKTWTRKQDGSPVMFSLSKDAPKFNFPEKELQLEVANAQGGTTTLKVPWPHPELASDSIAPELRERSLEQLRIRLSILARHLSSIDGDPELSKTTEEYYNLLTQIPDIPAFFIGKNLRIRRYAVEGKYDRPYEVKNRSGEVQGYRFSLNSTPVSKDRMDSWKPGPRAEFRLPRSFLKDIQNDIYMTLNAQGALNQMTQEQVDAAVLEAAIKDVFDDKGMINSKYYLRLGIESSGPGDQGAPNINPLAAPSAFTGGAMGAAQHAANMTQNTLGNSFQQAAPQGFQQAAPQTQAPQGFGQSTGFLNTQG